MTHWRETFFEHITTEEHPDCECSKTCAILKPLVQEGSYPDESSRNGVVWKAIYSKGSLQ